MYMTNIQSLLTIADNNAFSNLYEVSIGLDTSFTIRIESVNIDGASVDYTVNEATRQHQLTKAQRSKSISIRVRETDKYYFYKYLYNWYNDFYDQNNNFYVTGIAGKRRAIVIKALGNSDTSSSPQITIKCDNAMIQKLPSLNLSYASSQPIVYDISFVADKITRNPYTLP